MKAVVFTFLIAIISFPVKSHAQNFLWARNIGAESIDEGKSVATDADGNVFLAGEFWSAQVQVGSITLYNHGTESEDILIVKYGSDGRVLWCKNIGGTGPDYINCIKTDAAGNVLIAGSFSSPSIQLDEIILYNTDIQVPDFFVAKYNNNGNLLWAKSAGGYCLGNVYPVEHAYSVDSDLTGNIYLAGAFKSDQLQIGTTTLTNNGGGNGRYDCFLVKYDANGNVKWAKNIGGSSDDLAQSVSVDKSGNPYITGFYWSDTMKVGSDTLRKNGSQDFFIAKYDNNGNALWAKSAGGILGDFGTGIASDKSGNVYVTGVFNSKSITFNNFTLTNSGSNTDMFIVKYDSMGSVQFAKSEGKNYATSLSIDEHGNPYVTGYVYQFYIGLFISKYDPLGNITWRKTAGGKNGIDRAYAITVDKNGYAYTTGEFHSTYIVFGNDTLKKTLNSMYQDIFLAKINTYMTSVSEINDNSVNYLLSNNYPNPFNPTTEILYDIKKEGLVTLKIYDVLGREVACLVNENKTMGNYKVIFNGKNITSGVYFYSINVNGFSSVKKMVLLR